MAQKRNLDLDKIIDQATELISKKGLTATTLPALAKALDVRSQSLYHYVSGRKQLLSLVGARLIKRSGFIKYSVSFERISKGCGHQSRDFGFN